MQQRLAELVAASDCETLAAALKAVLEAAEKSGDPAVAARLGMSPDSLIDFDAGVRYAADLATAHLQPQPTRP